MERALRNRELPTPNWQEFQGAMKVFSGDLGIVGHAGETTISPFGQPKEYGQYSLTQIPADMSEEQFGTQMANIGKVVITCMDKRVARAFWETERGQSGGVMILAIGGGGVQSANRHVQMEIIARYLAQFKTVEEVVVAGHDRNCGAVRQFLRDVNQDLDAKNGLPDLLKVPLGDSQERDIMAQLVVHGAQPWVEAFGEEKVKVKNVLIDEERQGIEVIDIDMAQVAPLTIGELAGKLLVAKI